MNKVALKLRTSAEKCQAKIDKGLAHRETNTAKKLATAMSAKLDAYRWQRVQAMMLELANLHERGAVPEVLAKTTSAVELYRLAHSKTEMVRNGYHAYHVCTGMPASDAPDVVAAWALLTPKTEAELKAEKLAEMEAQLRLSKLPGFFPTPRHLVTEMLAKLYRDYDYEGAMICDPNGGSAAILDQLKVKYPKASIGTGEISPYLRELLELKGYEILWHDFLAEDPGNNPALFDAVVMNPPFENLADCDHIQHAYKYLSVNGELVAIMSPSAFARANSGSSKKATAFVEWFTSVGGQIIRHIDSGEFKESGTMVSTVMVKIVRREG